ncbi:TonB-dependent receptor [Phenylobacterium sp.]|jgi:iron complex outermembrane receptor protein|uniref:TonB-dependent receptor n=1 Tax=Phenylobacterium sp. TaxID=1871053 RepID=UPI0037C8CAFF
MIYQKQSTARRTIWLAGASVLLLSTGAAQEVNAQTAAAGTQVEEVIVTSRKREERLRDIPTAATTLSAEQLRDLGGVPNLQNLLANVPAVNFANTSNQVTSEVSIRGSGTSRATAAESGVGLYRNGAYLGGGTVGGRTFSRLDFFDVSGIEVLRGVQGALNGRNAVGGSINLLSARPIQGQQSGIATAKIGQNQMREGSLVINQPLTDNLALRVGVLQMKQKEGFFYNPVRDEYFDAQKQDFARIQLNYRGENFTANLLAERGNDKLPGIMYSLRIAPGTNLTYPRGFVEDKYNISWSASNAAKMRTHYYEFVGSYDLDFAEVTLTSSLRERHSQNAFDGDASSAQLQAQLAARGLVAPGRVQGDPNTDSIQFSYASILYNDIHIAGNKVDKLSWLGGFEYYVLNEAVGGIAARTPTTANRSLGNRTITNLDFTSYAIYGAVGYDLTDALNVEAEARYTNDSKSYDAARLDLSTGLAIPGNGFPSAASGDSGNFSYNVTLGYKVYDWLTYAKMGTAYRAGGFNAVRGDDRAPVPVPPTFDDEDSMAFELGAKGNITSNIFLTAAAYRTYVKSLLVQTDNGCFAGSTVCPVAATNFIFNSGKARLGGVEVELTGRWRLFDGVARLTAGVSRQWGVITDGRDKGRVGPQRPDWTGTFSANYRRPITDEIDGFINIRGNFRKGGVQEIAQTPLLEDFTIFDLRLGATMGEVEAAFFLNNFANESYRVFNAPTVIRWNMPQTWGVEVTYRW